MNKMTLMHITQEIPRDAYPMDKGNVLKGNKLLN